MKKEILLISYLLLSYYCLKAQRFNAGFSFGAVASDIHGMDSRDMDNDFNKLGFTAGGIVNTKMDDKNIFQMEINYIQKGSLQRPDSLNNGYYKFAADYVDAAFLFRHHAKFSIQKTLIDKFDWEAGISIGRLVRNTWVLNNYPYPIDETKINKIDISPLIGIDYNISPHVCFCVRYSNSVIPVIKHDVIPVYLYRYYYNIGNNMAAQFVIKIVFGGSASKEGNN